MVTAYTDRSRTLRWQHCPRSRWWEYEYAGRGIKRRALAIPLTVGGCVHVGIGALLEQARDGKPVDVETAIGLAHRQYDQDLSSRDLDLGADGDQEYAVQEQRALIEGLVRVWAKRCLSALLGEFEVVEVEREDVLPLAQDLVWMARADALLVERDSRDLYVFSLKTARRWDERQARQNEHDMQGLSEAAAVEYRLALYKDGKLRPPKWWIDAGKPTRIFGVKMEYLLKGDRKKTEGLGYVQQSPLIRGYRRLTGGSVTENEYEHAHSWYWNCVGPHPMRTSKWYPTGECEGGRRHALSGGWDTFNVWEEMQIRKWIELLDSGVIQPLAGDVLDQQIVRPVPYFRSSEQMEDWREQVTAQEGCAAAQSAICQNAPKDYIRAALNNYFPQYSSSCDYPVECPYQRICFGGDAIGEDPVGSGLYVWRTPHHEPELVRRKNQLVQEIERVYTRMLEKELAEMLTPGEAA